MVVRREEEGIPEWKAAVGAENLEAGATYELTVMAMTRVAQDGRRAVASEDVGPIASRAPRVRLALFGG